uniref:Protein kinase domain-containing protein n=1 Tax=Acrobeloides nanus TaxID=290746 RepID=A0A914E0K6_9BILA
MWSLGIIVYLLLSGVSPFYDDNEDVIPIKVSKGEWEFIEEFDEFSDEARDFVSKLLVIDKSQRMLPTACLAHPWLAVHHEKFKNIEELRAPTEGKTVDTEKLKKYVKNKTFRKTVFGVMFANRVSKTIGVLKAASSRLKRSMSLRKLSKDDEPSSSSDRISVCTTELDFKTENEAQAEATEVVKSRRHETCSINVDVTSHAKI